MNKFNAGSRRVGNRAAGEHILQTYLREINERSLMTASEELQCAMRIIESTDFLWREILSVQFFAEVVLKILQTLLRKNLVKGYLKGLQNRSGTARGKTGALKDLAEALPALEALVVSPNYSPASSLAASAIDKQRGGKMAQCLSDLRTSTQLFREIHFEMHWRILRFTFFDCYSQSNIPARDVVDELQRIGLPVDNLSPEVAQEKQTELLEELGLSSGEFQDLISRVSSLEDQIELAKNDLARGNLRLVVSIAKGYLGYRIPLPDLISEGNIGLMQGVERYDPAHKTRFSTYATYWIKQAIKRAIPGLCNFVHIPAYMIELQSKARRAIAKAERPLNAEELANALGISRKKAGEVLTHMRQQISYDQSSEDARTASELPAVNNNPFHGEEFANRAQGLISQEMSRLDPRTALVIVKRFGLDGEEPKTLKEVGEIIGLTRERVRQLEAEGLEALGTSSLLSDLLVAKLN